MSQDVRRTALKDPAPRCDQAGLVGQDDSLDAVAEVELGY